MCWTGQPERKRPPLKRSGPSQGRKRPRGATAQRRWRCRHAALRQLILSEWVPRKVRQPSPRDGGISWTELADVPWEDALWCSALALQSKPDFTPTGGLWDPAPPLQRWSRDTYPPIRPRNPFNPPPGGLSGKTHAAEKSRIGFCRRSGQPIEKPQVHFSGNRPVNAGAVYSRPSRKLPRRSHQGFVGGCATGSQGTAR